MSTVIARTAMRLVFPITLVTALALLLQGHNLPGGGFIGAVLATTGIVLIYIVGGRAELENVIGLRTPEESLANGPVGVYRFVFGIGLLVAAGSGIVPILLGYPFLTQSFWILHDVPLFGEVELASALAFDIGVFLTIVGGLLTIIGVVGSE